MKKTNRVFVTFVATTVAVFVVLWKGMQSEHFARLISPHISRFLVEHITSSYAVSIQKIELEILPPTTILKNVAVKDRKTDAVVFEAEKISGKFNLMDFIANYFGKSLSQVDKLSVENASVYWPRKPKKSGFSTTYKKLVNLELPLNIQALSLRNVNLDAGAGKCFLKNLDIKFSSKVLNVTGEIEPANDRDALWPNFPKVNQLAFYISATDKNLKINYLTASETLSRMRLSGVVKILEGEFRPADLKFDFEGDSEFLGKVVKNVHRKKNFFLPGGFLRLNGRVEGDLGNPRADLSLKWDGIDSDFARLDSAEAQLSLNKSKLTVTKLKGSVNGGSAETTRPFDLVNVKTGKMLLKKIRLKANRVLFNDVIHFVKNPTLHNLKFRVSGPIDLDFNKSHLEISPQAGVRLEDFTVSDPDGPPPIVANPLLENYGKSKIRVFHKGGPVEMELMLKFPESHVHLEGTVGKNDVDFKLHDSFIDFEKFGPLAGLAMFGRGHLTGKVTGPFDDVVFNFNVAAKDFSFLDIHLGQAYGNVKFFLEDSRLELDNVNGRFNNLEYNTFGKVFFEGREKLPNTV